MVFCSNIEASAGFLGTDLHRDAVRASRFLTIDRWRNEEDWRSFLHAFGPAYESLDARLEGLAVAERSLSEGSLADRAADTRLGRRPPPVQQFTGTADDQLVFTGPKGAQLGEATSPVNGARHWRRQG